jgi:hypothetical protein
MSTGSPFQIVSMRQIAYIFIVFIVTCFCLKGPKHEIYVAEHFTQCKPVWVDAVGYEEMSSILADQ